MKICYILLSHFRNEYTELLFSKLKNDISKVTKYEIECFYLDTTEEINYNILKEKYDLFKYPGHKDDDSNIYVGNSIWPIVEFSKIHPDFDRYIIQEYDVEFIGDYGELFERIPFEEYDCIFQEIPLDDKDWSWHRFGYIPKIKKYHNLLQWYCISIDALKYFEDFYILNRCTGHYEGLLPSIIMASDFRIGYLCNYFDTVMEYCKFEFHNKFSKYVSAKNIIKDVFLHPIKI